MSSTIPPVSGPRFEAAVRSRADAVSVVGVEGELDIATAGTLRDLLVGQISPQSPNLVIDMSGVTFCDSQGLGALQAAAAGAEASGGTVTLVGPRPHVLKILRITGLDRRMRVGAARRSGGASPCRARRR